MPDSCIGYSQDHMTQWAGYDWVEQDSYHPTGSQLMGRKCRAGDRLAASPYVDDVVRRGGGGGGGTGGIPHASVPYLARRDQIA